MAKVLLLCADVVGEAMAGPAIRYWEFARSLSRSHEVILSTPNESRLSSSDFEIHSLAKLPLPEAVKQSEVVITQRISHQLALHAKKHRVKIILDAYDPQPLENLEIFKHRSLDKRNLSNIRSVNALAFSLRMADGIICANDKQRDIWVGFLMSLKKIAPEIYDRDPSLKQFIDIIPFGLSATPPQRNDEGLRSMFNLKPTDKVVLWGGGIWNWFDPLSLIKGMKKVSEQRSDIKLVFMGVKHPNDKVPEMKMATMAYELSKQLGLLDTHVFFNFSWIPYNQRQNFLLEADIGASTHFDHLETRYAFRTRMLDYIWASLPIIATKGDCFADLIDAEGLGVVVPYEDSEAIAQGIIKLIDHPEKVQQIKQNLSRIRPAFYWDTLTQPLDAMICRLAELPKKTIQFRDIAKIAASFWGAKGPWQILKYCYVQAVDRIYRRSNR